MLVVAAETTVVRHDGSLSHQLDGVGGFLY
jgi:hypothetical protein